MVLLLFIVLTNMCTLKALSCFDESLYLLTSRTLKGYKNSRCRMTAAELLELSVSFMCPLFW